MDSVCGVDPPSATLVRYTFFRHLHGVSWAPSLFVLKLMWRDALGLPNLTKRTPEMQTAVWRDAPGLLLYEAQCGANAPGILLRIRNCKCAKIRARLFFSFLIFLYCHFCSLCRWLSLWLFCLGGKGLKWWNGARPQDSEWPVVVCDLCCA